MLGPITTTTRLECFATLKELVYAISLACETQPEEGCLYDAEKLEVAARRIRDANRSKEEGG